jgi:hypothetical protein
MEPRFELEVRSDAKSEKAEENDVESSELRPQRKKDSRWTSEEGEGRSETTKLLLFRDF